ncbi:MAG TPA: class I SAM-dependent methyltransferase [Chthoniobacterales bacterium]
MINSSCPATAHEVAEHYDELDRYYREIWGEHVHHGLWERGNESVAEAVVNLVRAVARRGRITKGMRVCDVGCGYGGTARILDAEFGAAVTAITVSLAQYLHAITLRGDARHPEYLLGDWLNNDLPSGAFDAVISVESSEHMPDKPTFFAQAHRVLKTDGRMVVCAWLAAENPTRWQRRHVLEPICREGRLPSMGTESEYREWFSDAMLQVESFEDVSANVRRTWSICLARILPALIRRPEYLRFLLNSRARNRIFLITIARIWCAYAVGAMRYGIFAARKV